MRPLELTLRDFRSHVGTTTFDFRGRRLVGIVGPIGSGKSSILDAVSFALYGKTPTIQKATRSLINQRADGATVALRFQVEGAVWEVVRAIRRRGQSQHALSRLDGDRSDAEAIEKITQESEVNQRVVELLGLEFDAFGRSVMLAQGRFAEFLRARPGQRDSVLKGVFGHERIDAMREVARRRGEAAARDLEKQALRVEHLDRVAARIAENRARLLAVEDRIELLRKAEPRVVELEEAIDAAKQRAVAAAERLEELAELETRFPDPPIVEDVLGDAGRAAEDRRRLADLLDAAHQAVARAEQTLAEVDRSGERDVVERCEHLLARLGPQREALEDADRRHRAAGERLERNKAAEQAAVERLDRAENAVRSAGEEAATAAAAVRAAEQHFHERQHADMAAALRQDLADGDVCPVCEQQVAEVPAPTGPSDLAEARTALEDARAASGEADQHRSAADAEGKAAKEGAAAARRAVEAVEADVHEAARAAESARQAVDGTTRELEERLGAGDPVELLEARRSHLAAAVGDLEAARREAERTRQAHDEAIVAEQQAGRALADLRVALTELAIRIDPNRPPPGQEVDDLSSAAAELRADWQREIAGLGEARATAQQEVDRARQERSAVLAGLDLDGTLPEALAAATATAELLTTEIRRDEIEVTEADAVVELHDRLSGRLDVFNRLVADLTDSRFVRFLLDEERARLADLGSDHFQLLSSGRYRFTDDGAFDIVDLTSADAVRKADSLSGGETFLASLALALALAEMVARRGGRLDAFFLDEGFGSLDPEHLDLAMEGIEALVADAPDRLVVMVSHVPEVRHRLEDLIVLDRDPLTGSSIVRAGSRASGS